MHDDDDFDDLLRRAGTTTVVRTETLDRLVERSRSERLARRRRAPKVIGIAVVGAVLLAAAASSTDWTRIAPFQSLAADMYRTHTAIPVDFTTTSGLPVRCQAFLEFTHLSAQQAEQADAYVGRQDWAGLGQRLYDRGAPQAESFEHAQTRIFDALDPVLRASAAAAVPAAAASGADADADAARISGWSAICRRAAR